MIICSNCGATNNELEGRICRKCGALLPLGNRNLRIRVPFSNAQPSQSEQKSEPKHAPQKPIVPRPNPEVSFFSPQEKVQPQPKPEPKPPQPSFQEIPKLTQIPSPQKESPPQQNVNSQSVNRESLSSIPMDLNDIPMAGLKEIAPQPFRSPIIPQGGVRSPQVPQNQPIPTPDTRMIPTIPQTPPSQNQQMLSTSRQADTSVIVTKSLETEMSGILSELSKQIVIPKESPQKSNNNGVKAVEHKLPPASMNEILNELLVIDNRIEASALIQHDGTILASALTNSITDGLFSTIGRTLSIIGTDIINGLNAGDLKSISVRGTHGLLNVAPINIDSKRVKSMFLIMFSSAKVKSGVINIALSKIKRLIKEYLGIEIKKKSK